MRCLSLWCFVVEMWWSLYCVIRRGKMRAAVELTDTECCGVWLRLRRRRADCRRWEEEEEEEGGEHYHGGGSSYGRVECCIIKALIRITRRSTRSGLCVRPGVTGGLGGHIVLSNVVYFYSLRFECITFDLWWYGTISRVRIHIYFISICASNFNVWTSHEPCSSFWKQKESYILN